MWKRSELKDRAKWVLKQCYWKAVLVSLILGVIMGGGSSVSSSTTTQLEQSISSGDFSYEAGMMIEAFLVAFSFMLVGLLVVAVILGIFLFAPLEVNIRRFFIISRVQPAELNELGFCFKKNIFMNVVKIQFLRSLYTFLWSLLLIIPGIIKSYEYRMVPYILAEQPDMDSKRAFQISKDMMYGEKWNAFVLDLSFLGWDILSLFTCGILSVFYVNPYRNLTDAELYDVLKCKLFGNNMNGNGTV